jgi:hypothetical protein
VIKKDFAEYNLCSTLFIFKPIALQPFDSMEIAALTASVAIDL